MWCSLQLVPGLNISCKVVSWRINEWMKGPYDDIYTSRRARELILGSNWGRIQFPIHWCILKVCTLYYSCLMVHGGVPIVLCFFWDPLVLRINGLVIRDWFIALFLNPEYSILMPWILIYMSINKQSSTLLSQNYQYFAQVDYFKERQVLDWFKFSRNYISVQLCQPLEVSNPLATSHTFEQLKYMFPQLGSWENIIWYDINLHK